MWLAEQGRQGSSVCLTVACGWLSKADRAALCVCRLHMDSYHWAVLHLSCKPFWSEENGSLAGHLRS